MRIDYLIFGYRTARIAPNDRARAATSLMKAGICGKINNEGEIVIPPFSYKRYQRAFGDIEYTVSAPSGLFGALLKNRRRYGGIAGILLSLVLLLLSLDFVFDIRIETDGAVPASVIYEALGEADFYIGKRWSKSELDEIEGEVLINNSDIGWISINRRGTVAYISVKEKTHRTEEQIEPKGNIVAKYDCVIEEITVKRGVAAVKAGDTVKAGDLLISGVIPAELGGGTVAAEGEIIGRISTRVEAFAGESEYEKVYGAERLLSVKINILDFSVNIFKNYRNLSGEYDIIKSEEVFCTNQGTRFPISIEKIYAEPYSSAELRYTEEELVRLASARLSSRQSRACADSEIIKIRTGGEFQDEGYTMYSDILMLSKVGKYQSFE